MQIMLDILHTWSGSLKSTGSLATGYTYACTESTNQIKNTLNAEMPLGSPHTAWMVTLTTMHSLELMKQLITVQQIQIIPKALQLVSITRDEVF